MSSALSKSLIDRLLEELQDEKSWRIEELAKIKKLNAELHLGDSTASDILKKMTVPYLYAHWEGFCVSAFKMLFSYLNKPEFKYEDLNYYLITYANSQSYDYLKGKHSFDQKVKFTNSFMNKINHNIFRIEGKVETKSNVNYEVIEDLFLTIGVQPEAISELKALKADLNSFVNIRNSIAHGETSIGIDLQKIENFYQLVSKLMDYIILEFQDYLQNENYKPNSKVAI